MKELLYILLNNYAEHELTFLAQAIKTDESGVRKNSKYVNRYVAPTLDPVTSIAGLRTLPDYSFETMPQDYAGLVLIGGYDWLTPNAEPSLPIIEAALAAGKPVGAICNATAFMAKHGFLNHVKHTGNGLQALQAFGGSNYTNAAGYVNKQAVRDGNIITANGTGQLEFAREFLYLIENDTPEMIERFYYFNKVGLVEIMRPQPRFKFNTIGLFTRDNALTVKFYTEVFGFTTDWDGIQPNVEMKLNDSRIILFPRTDFEQMVSHTFEYPKGLNGTAELSFDVPNFAAVDAEYANALRYGATSVLAPTTEPWGQRTCYVADPDGNLIEISSFQA